MGSNRGVDGPRATTRGYDLFMVPWERMGVESWRKQLIQQVVSPVLEVGIGTGASLRWYSQDAQLVAIDPAWRKLSTARHRAWRERRHVTLAQMDVQGLAFPADTFASVVASLVFCSVHSPVQGLMELRRVLRPDGRLYMLEHVRPANPLLGALMDSLNVPWQLISGDCRLNRQTAANVAAAGFQVESVESRMGGLLNLIVARA